MDSLPSHPFAELFALLSPDSIPEWTSVVELLRRWSDEAESPFGDEEDDDGASTTTTTDQWLEKLKDARELVRETEEQLLQLYFDRVLCETSSSSAQAGTGEEGGDVGDAGEGPNADADEICRRLVGVVDLKEGTSGLGGEGNDLDRGSEELCETAVDQSQADSHETSEDASGHGEADDVVHALDVYECAKAHIPLDLKEGTSGLGGEGHDLDLVSEGLCETAVDQSQAASHETSEHASGHGEADDVVHTLDVDECAKAHIPLGLKEGTSGLGGEGHDLDRGSEELCETVVDQSQADSHETSGDASGHME